MTRVYLYFDNVSADVKLFTVNPDGKFRKGDIVYERISPNRKMVVKHFTDGLYYCHFPENLKRLFVYPERELMTIT
jgi:hypothetical protein